jgi:hypothetical protein
MAMETKKAKRHGVRCCRPLSPNIAMLSAIIDVSIDYMGTVSPSFLNLKSDTAFFD